MSTLSLWHQDLGSFGKGLLITLEITCLALAVSIAFGAVLAACRMSKLAVLRGLATAYVELMRATPVLILIFVAYYGLGQEGFKLDGFTTAWLGIGAFYAALYCETFRGGVQSVPTGQWEAAQALGMGPLLKLRKIVLPQAFVAVLLPSTNNASYLLKDTSLVFFIPGVVDLMTASKLAASQNLQYMSLYVFAGLFYFAIYLVMSQALGRWESRVQRSRA